VWLVGGGSHNSVAVEFKDFVTVIEAPLDEERSLAVIEAVTKLVPNKAIRYVVNTHHHFDHSGGLRTYVSQGAIVLATPTNLEFYRTVMFHPLPRTLRPDRLSTFAPMFTVSRRPVPMEPVNRAYVVSDGTRTLELHPVTGNPHAVGMLVAYLPAEKILINGDLYGPPVPNAPPAPPNPAMTSLMNNIRRLKLDVAQHVPIHGTPGPHAEFLKRFPGGTQ
jgi:glyoxylase-like metal-dependent hydrolase (beta-lactamase superfamily II)